MTDLTSAAPLMKTAMNKAVTLAKAKKAREVKLKIKAAVKIKGLNDGQKSDK